MHFFLFVKRFIPTKPCVVSVSMARVSEKGRITNKAAYVIFMCEGFFRQSSFGAFLSIGENPVHLVSERLRSSMKNKGTTEMNCVRPFQHQEKTLPYLSVNGLVIPSVLSPKIRRLHL